MSDPDRPEEPASQPGAGPPSGREQPVPDQPMPNYRGAPLDPDRGPGLGCFWIQMALLAVLLVVTPLSVVMAAPPWLSGLLLIVSLVLLLFVGQTTIFLLRLVAVDRRTRRRPLSTTARKTVGQLEEESAQPVEEASRRVGDPSLPVDRPPQSVHEAAPPVDAAAQHGDEAGQPADEDLGRS